MVEDDLLRRHLPQTQIFTPEALWTYAEKFNQVILKPSGGGGGAGLMQLTRKNNGKYLVHAGKVKRLLQGKSRTIDYIQSRFRKSLYLLQPRIPLGTIDGKPFDVRVMIQRKSGEHPWTVTGWLAKLAGPGYVVTNVARSGGVVLPLEEALRLSNVTASPQLPGKIREISLTVAETLAEKYPILREVGLDVGIDIKGKPWIIEANFRPALSLFRQLKDQADYKRILAIRRKYWYDS
ncbi:MAG: YheC/YheD family protein [Clostridia bacterium]